MNLLANLNLNKNELQNARIQNLAQAPAEPKVGQIYYNTVNKLLYVFDGSAWKSVGIVYNQENSTDAVITGIDGSGNVSTTDVGDLVVGDTALSEIVNIVNGVEAGAEVNVQSDWTETDTNSDAFILNKPEIYTKDEIDDMVETIEGTISGIGAAVEGGLKYAVADALPDLTQMSDEEFANLTNGTIYLIAKNTVDDSNPNLKDEYLFIKGEDAAHSRFELIGDTAPSLDGYLREEDLQDALSGLNISDAVITTGDETEQTISDAIDAIPVVKKATGTIAVDAKTCSVTTASGATIMSVIAKSENNVVYTDVEISDGSVKFEIADVWTKPIVCEVFYL